jgi:hypothetical protein
MSPYWGLVADPDLEDVGLRMICDLKARLRIAVSAKLLSEGRPDEATMSDLPTPILEPKSS